MDLLEWQTWHLCSSKSGASSVLMMPIGAWQFAQSTDIFIRPLERAHSIASCFVSVASIKDYNSMFDAWLNTGAMAVISYLPGKRGSNRRF
jgi:hypothetical protein